MMFDFGEDNMNFLVTQDTQELVTIESLVYLCDITDSVGNWSVWMTSNGGFIAYGEISGSVYSMHSFVIQHYLRGDLETITSISPLLKEEVKLSVPIINKIPEPLYFRKTDT